LSLLEIPFEPKFDQLQKIALGLTRSDEPVCEANIKRCPEAGAMIANELPQAVKRAAI